jgi:hypothetical protein
MKGFRRPRMVVLPDRALLPEGSLVEPPARLTHVLSDVQPYFYSPTTTESAGSFEAGAQVALLSSDGPRCRVVNEHGLSVFVSCDGLQPLAERGSKARPPSHARAAASRTTRSRRKP